MIMWTNVRPAQRVQLYVEVSIVVVPSKAEYKVY